MTAVETIVRQVEQPEAALPVVFGSGRSLTVGHGPLHQMTCPRSDLSAFADDVVASLDADGTIRAVGTLSFRREEPSRFVRPAWSEQVPADRFTALTGVGLRSSVRGEHPTGDEYGRRVAAAVEGIAADPRLDKIVLGRWLEITGEDVVEPIEVLAGLLRRAVGAHVYALPPEAVAGAAGASLVGASPELLVSRHGSMVRSVPLAGSIPRSADPVEDARRAAGLQASAKDQVEHGFVVTAIAEVLAGFCPDLQVPAAPHLIATDTMWHLATDIRGELSGPEDQLPSALHLAQLLHPTPAVCGHPRELAYDLIAELEPEPRGPMTGAVGWVDGHGDGEFVVTIRSALIGGTGRSRSVRLFAGAGIVPGSEPAAEVAETAAKLTTVLRAMEER